MNVIITRQFMLLEKSFMKNLHIYELCIEVLNIQLIIYYKSSEIYNIIYIG